LDSDEDALRYKFDFEYLSQDTPGLETIDAKAKIFDAIRIMCTKNYSQLPILKKAENGSVTCEGVVTIQSFLQVLKQRCDNGNEKIGEIMQWPVERFKMSDEPIFVRPCDHILDYIDDLQRLDFILIGSRNKCNSMVTSSDFIGFFKNKTEVFLILCEIETSLRFVITKSLEAEKLQGILESVKANRKNRGLPVPIRALKVEDLFLEELKSIINGNFADFQRYFKDEKKIDDQLEYIRELRNKVFHFRSTIGVSEMTHIKRLGKTFLQTAEIASSGEK
jgi:hypothetical protein